ncbi:MAG: adenosine deaminase [Alphaproteobacteria bacterium]
MANKKNASVNTTDIPKVTLHEHLEGTVTPDMAQKLANRHNVKLPENLFMAKGTYDAEDFPDGRYAYDESQFSAFIDTYNTVSELIRTPQDYYDIAKDYLSKNAKEGGVYAELILSPIHMAVEKDETSGEMKLSAKRYHEMMNAITKAADEVKKEYGLETRYIVTGVRNMGAENVESVVDFIKKNPHPMVTGFGIAGNEASGHFDDFAKASQIADELGLKKSYHAGEIIGPESIRAALKHGAVRIGHGISSVKDPELMETLAQKGVTVEVCPTSNRILVPEVKGDLKNHPLKTMYDAGIRVSINPDDAGIFGTHTGKEYRIAQEKFAFTRAELFDISLNAVEAAFTDSKTIDSVKSKIISKMSVKDKAEMNKLATTAQNPYLKARLQKRVVEIGSYDKSKKIENINKIVTQKALKGR